MDRLLDQVEATVSVGARQLCCRLGIAGRSFARGVANLKEAAQIEMGEELFRQVVEGEGKASAWGWWMEPSACANIWRVCRCRR